MKKYLTARMRFPAIVIAAVLATVAMAAPQPLLAQSTSEKVRLMADTLRARDSGNLEAAKEKAEELIKIAPQDANVQRLLASINERLDRRAESSGGSAPSVSGESSEAAIEAAMEADPQASETESVIATAAAEQEARIQAAESAVDEALQLAELGAFTEANNLLDSAASSLSLNTATAETIATIETTQAELILMQARELANSGNFREAEALVEDYRAAGGDPRKANALAKRLDKEISDPYKEDIEELSPDFVAQQKTTRDLLTRARAQFLNGDYEGAQATFNEVEARDANNAEAKLFQTRIAKILGDIHEQNQYKTRRQMLTEVDQGWERPKVFDVTTAEVQAPADGGLREKLNKIIIPQVQFSGMELTRVIETLSELAKVYDPEGKGLNIVPIFNPNETNPRVNITLSDLNLDRILQFVTQQVNFSYDVGADAVTIQPSDNIGGISNTSTETFPISRPTVLRLTGYKGSGGSSSSSVNPFAAPQDSGGGGQGMDETTESLRNFFQSAGVNFDLPGTSLAYDETQLIVTQTDSNLQRMRNLLRNYNDEKQVEIEAKFLEVAQNDLEELGFNWEFNDGARQLVGAGGTPILDDFGQPTTRPQRTGQTVGRTLNDSFTTDASTAAINISGFDPIPVSPPSLNTAIDLASGAGNIFNAAGWTAGGMDVNMAIRALSRKTGTDLMSAPKVTILNNQTASITVAQQLRYPESYSDIESNVSGGNSGGNNNGGGGGSSSISITAGTPQDFRTQNVGVELEVTPSVQRVGSGEDMITLELSPKVTEFEGFVEYGGPSVAVSGGSSGGVIDGVLVGGTEATVVTVPAGFYQPIFSTREISTSVNVFDGATVVMGGLTRDEVKTFNDKVPVLGDIPGLGRLFRSEGETRQKRNLLIFVTANLISPGGSPARQNYRNVEANSLFQNPSIMTPAGSANRSIDDSNQ